MKQLFRNRKIYMYAGLLLLVFAEQLFAARRYGLSHSYSAACIVINAIMGIGLIAGIYYYDQKHISLTKLYALFGTAMGLVFMIMLPIYVVPDEPVHIMSTYSLSNKIMGIKDEEGSTLLRVCDLEMPEVVSYQNVETYDAYYSRFTAETGDTSLQATRAPKTDAPFYSYLPAAIGLTIGRLLNLNTVMTYLLGRLFNLIVFVILMCFAIKIIPYGKMTAFIVGLMPMTLQEAASFSYDWFIICFSVLVTALSLYAYRNIREGKEVSRLNWGILAVSSLLVFSMKGHAYFSIALLPVLLIISDRFKISEQAARVIKLAGITLLVLIVFYTGYRTFFAQGDLVAVPENYLEYADTQGYTIQYFINHPSRILLVLFGTIKMYDMSLIEQAVGDSLGWLEISVFRPVLYWFIACLLISPELDDEPAPAAGERIILLISGVISVICVFAGMLLHWTPQESIAVLGVQGRYFIPTALLFLLPIKGNRWITVNKAITKFVCISVMFALTILVELLLVGI